MVKEYDTSHKSGVDVKSWTKTKSVADSVLENCDIDKHTKKLHIQQSCLPSRHRPDGGRNNGH